VVADEAAEVAALDARLGGVEDPRVGRLHGCTTSVTLSDVSTAELDDDDRRLLRRLGYGTVPDHVEVPAGAPRPAAEVLDRLLARHAVVAVARGLDPAAGRRLLDGWDVRHALTEDEGEYLADAADGVRVEDAARALGVEAVAVLAWALALGPEPPVDEPVHDLPELTLPDDPALGPTDELRRACARYEAMRLALAEDPDLAVGAAPGAVDPYVVHERAAALRWLFGRA
jgi:hypothetical protein